MTSEIGLSNVPTTLPAVNDTSTIEDTSNTLGQDAFLELLIAQIENQNPLDPSDPTEFMSQLANFSTLEQMTQMNDGIESLATLQTTAINFQNIDLVGKTAVFEGATAPVTRRIGVVSLLRPFGGQLGSSCATRDGGVERSQRDQRRQLGYQRSRARRP